MYKAELERDEALLAQAVAEECSFTYDMTVKDLRIQLKEQKKAFDEKNFLVWSTL